MRKIATIILGLGSITGVIQAETHAVLAGGSIQEKIDLAVDGDIVAIFGGTYNQDLTITKRIRLVEINGQDVTITGNITFTSVADCPPFEGFTVGSNANKDITVTDTTGLVMSGIDHTAGRSIVVDETSDIEITDSELNGVKVGGKGTVRNVTTTGNLEFSGSELIVTGSTTGGFVQTKGELHISEVTINGDFSTNDNAAKTVAFRTTVTGDCNWQSKLAWFGYGKALSFNFNGADAKVVFVGSEIDRRDIVGGNGITLSGENCRCVVSNSKIVGVRSRYQRFVYTAAHCIDVGGAGLDVVITNNYLLKNHSGSAVGGTTFSPCIRFSASTSKMNISNNILHQTQPYYSLIVAPFTVSVSNNHSVNSAGRIEGGVVALNTTTGDPLLVDSNPYQLAAGSPLIDAGTEDPRYNDRDGSRNDIGPSGGSWYDPEGWTTEKPVVISFDLLPDSVLEGVDTKVTIEGVRAVSKP